MPIEQILTATGEAATVKDRGESPLLQSNFQN